MPTAHRFRADSRSTASAQILSTWLEMPDQIKAADGAHAGILSDIRIPETLAKVIFPTIWKCRQLRCTAKEFLVLGIGSVQINDVGNRQSFFLALFKINH